MVFRKGGFLSKGERWSINGKTLEVVNKYKYLGFVFTTKLSLSAALDTQVVRAKQKTLRLLNTMRHLHTQSVTVFFKLYDAQVLPALLYSSQLWGLSRRDNVERAHTFACKRFLGVDLKSSNNMCYGEIGRYPLFVTTMLQAIKYWLRLSRMPDSRLPRQSYLMLFSLDIPEEMNWLKAIESCLSSYGFSYIWNSGGTQNEKGFLKCFKQRLRDCYVQEWRARLSSSDRFSFYRTLKQSFECEEYFSFISIRKFRNAYVRFRLGCNDLKTNCRTRNSVSDMNCPFCEEPETEWHFLFKCKMYDDIRQKYLGRYQHIHQGNVVHFLNGKNSKVTRDASMFIFYAYQRRLLKLEEK